MLIITEFPIRLKRLFVHFLWFIPRYRNQVKQLKIVANLTDWILFIPMYIFDIFGIPNLNFVLHEFIFWNSRSLDKKEYNTAYLLFRNSIRYKLVRINENEKFVAKRLNIAYVNFHHINSYKKISLGLLMHELVHVWQYSQFGSVYIVKALRAQQSLKGYNYGGRSGLESVTEKGGDLLDFNFEQQGDIIEDFYKLYIGKRPSWIDYNLANLKFFKPFIQNLIENRRFSRGIEPFEENEK